MNSLIINECIYYANADGKATIVHSLDHTNCLSSPIVGHSHRQPTLSYQPSALELLTVFEYRSLFFQSGIIS